MNLRRKMQLNKFTLVLESGKGSPSRPWKLLLKWRRPCRKWQSTSRQNTRALRPRYVKMVNANLRSSMKTLSRRDTQGLEVAGSS